MQDHMIDPRRPVGAHAFGDIGTAAHDRETLHDPIGNGIDRLAPGTVAPQLNRVLQCGGVGLAETAAVGGQQEVPEQELPHPAHPALEIRSGVRIDRQHARHGAFRGLVYDPDPLPGLLHGTKSQVDPVGAASRGLQHAGADRGQDDRHIMARGRHKPEPAVRPWAVAEVNRFTGE
jgi:hypothetical protein